MGLGCSKDFAFMVFVGIVFWIGTSDYKNFLYIMGFYAIIKIIWRALR